MFCLMVEFHLSAQPETLRRLSRTRTPLAAAGARLREKPPRPPAPPHNMASSASAMELGKYNRGRSIFMRDRGEADSASAAGRAGRSERASEGEEARAGDVHGAGSPRREGRRRHRAPAGRPHRRPPRAGSPAPGGGRMTAAPPPPLRRARRPSRYACPAGCGLWAQSPALRDRVPCSPRPRPVEVLPRQSPPELHPNFSALPAAPVQHTHTHTRFPALRTEPARPNYSRENDLQFWRRP